MPPFDSGLSYLAEQLDGATSAVKEAIDAAREKDTALRKGVQEKKPLLKQATSLLGRFSRHLDGHRSGEVDRKAFFTADGTAGGVGKSAPQVLLAVTHIAGKLKSASASVRDRETWRQEFVEMMRALGPVVEHVDNVRTDRRELTPEVEAARQAWLQVYLAARAGVECVLRQRGKLDPMSAIFYDLAVPAGAKVTQIQEDDEAGTADEEPGEEGDAQEAPPKGP
jgi:hypothetical protein